MLELCGVCVSLERLNWFQVTYTTCPVSTDYLGTRDFAGAVCRCVFMNVTQILSSVFFFPIVSYIAYPKIA